MDLTLTGDIAKQIITLTKKDSKLAMAMARQFLSSIEPIALARYLLTPDVATGLLAARISKNPEQTLRQLQGLASGDEPKAGKPGRKPGRRPGRPARSGRRKRHRLTTEEIVRIKSEIRSFLGRHPWSNRKQIGEAVTFPSLAAYNRIMAELREERVIQAQGEKSKTVYAATGAGGKAAGRRGAKKATKAARTTKAGPAKKARATKAKPAKKATAARAPKAATITAAAPEKTE
jgi:hypothetical protein